MSLITRCPNCETLFKVVPDQLRVSEGWVRCGQCEEIFDASANLQEAVPEEAVQAAVASPPQSSEIEAAADSFEVQAEPADVPDAGAGPQDPVLESDESLRPPVGDETPLAAEVEPELQEQTEDQDEPESPPGRDEIEDVQDVYDVLEAVPEHPSEPLEPVFTQGFSPRAAKSQRVSDVSFMRKTRRNSVWRRPMVRLFLLLLSLGLSLALIMQIVVQERDRIVATEPAVRPWVQTVCVWFGCTVSPLRQIEAMVIDSSSFNKVHGETYRLNFTLKNSALTELATPAIELTLTDTQDRPVMRRVFTHAEVGIPSPVLASGIEANGTLNLSVKPVAGTERIAGYRVLAFYP